MLPRALHSHGPGPAGVTTPGASREKVDPDTV